MRYARDGTNRHAEQDTEDEGSEHVELTGRTTRPNSSACYEY